MLLKKNIKLGKIKLIKSLFYLIIFIAIFLDSYASEKDKNLEGNLVGVAYAALNKLEWIKAGLDKEIPLPTDMGYAIQSRMINKIFQYLLVLHQRKHKIVH